jgi:hypothetical protein
MIIIVSVLCVGLYLYGGFRVKCVGVCLRHLWAQTDGFCLGTMLLSQPILWVDAHAQPGLCLGCTRCLRRCSSIPLALFRWMPVYICGCELAAGVVNHAIAAHRRWSSICLVKNTGLCAQPMPITLFGLAPLRLTCACRDGIGSCWCIRI